MPSGPTYKVISSTTVSGSSTTSITFNSIPQTYTDLIIIFRIAQADAYVLARFNGDSSANYGRQSMFNNLSGNSAGLSLNETAAYPEGSSTAVGRSNVIWNILNYSSSTTNKTSLMEYICQPQAVAMLVTPYRSNTAITSITFTTPSANVFLSGSTITIYGVAAA